MKRDNTCRICGQYFAELSEDRCPTCLQQMRADVHSDKCDSSVDAMTLAPTSLKPAASSVQNRRLGDYELKDEIARGGMGVVYLARHVQLNRTVALKMVLGGRFSTADELRRFQFEAEAAAKLDHPAIVPVYDIGEHDGQAYFAMKLVDGGSLAERMQGITGDADQAVGLIGKIAEAIGHAHQRGVLHRDLKPANILLNSLGEPMITDFGLAKDTASNAGLTQTGAILGTPAYMPPEQARGSALTVAADIYSLGAIFYELLTGQPPYRGDSPLEVVMQVIEREPVAPRKINPSLDQDLELICLKCMQRDPQQRYATASDLAADLKAWRERSTC